MALLRTSPDYSPPNRYITEFLAQPLSVMGKLVDPYIPSLL